MTEVVHTAERLKELQALPLDRKVEISKARIVEWYNYWNGKVCISVSGGKDSQVLCDLVTSIYPDVPKVYSDTGLEYPEVRQKALELGAVMVRPKMMFTDVISTYGYPIFGKEVAKSIYYARRIKSPAAERERERERATAAGKTTYWEMAMLQGNRESGYKNHERQALLGILESEYGKNIFNRKKYLSAAQELPFMIGHKCCDIMKKQPLKSWQSANKSVSYLGTLAEESRLRKISWIRTGCNLFTGSERHSTPMAFWTEQDVLQYIKEKNLKIASVYGDIVECNGKLKCTGCDRTGCVYCGFGLHMYKKNEKTHFQLLAKTHPKQYEYAIGGGQWVDNPYYDEFAPEYDGDWKNWNPKKIWAPSKQGLGMGKVFDMVNDMYGKDFIRYE